MDEVDLANFTTISDANGEISKSDLIVHTKASSFWRNYMESNSKSGAVTSKVKKKVIKYSNILMGVVVTNPELQYGTGGVSEAPLTILHNNKSLIILIL